MHYIYAHFVVLTTYKIEMKYYALISILQALV